MRNSMTFLLKNFTKSRASRNFSRRARKIQYIPKTFFMKVGAIFNFDVLYIQNFKESIFYLLIDWFIDV